MMASIVMVTLAFPVQPVAKNAHRLSSASLSPKDSMLLHTETQTLAKYHPAPLIASHAQ